MVKKLTSFLLRTTGWRLAVKAVLASLALGLLAWAGFSFWPLLVFIVAVSAVYFSESPERKTLRSSFWLLAAFGLLGARIPSGLAGAPLHDLSSVFLAVVLGFLIFVWLGLLNSFFSDRLLAHSVLNAALAAFFFVLAFYFIPALGDDGVFSVILWFFSVFMGGVLLIRESLVFDASVRSGELKLAVWSFSFILVEVASLVSFLPLGFLNAAALLTLFYILGRDTFLAGFRGLLTFSTVFGELAIFAVVLGLIFATVTWILP